jgi:Complex I intermediate-associated protein 30 (CIA30)
MTDKFDGEPAKRWEFIADDVMGGVSKGSLSFEQEGSVSYARMTGRVSTANNGGFLQFRRRLDQRLSEETKGVRLVARGNNERYFIHLRTSGTVLPWQYYQSGFDVTGDWRELNLPLDSFKASGSLLRQTPKATSIKSIGIVAFGRDYDADIQVREVGFY